MDEIIGGWQNGQLTIIGGRPGMGKSRLMLQHYWAAAKQGKNPLLFNLEMLNQDTRDVMILARAMGKIDPQRFRSGLLTANEKDFKRSAEAELLEHSFYMETQRSLNQVESISRAMVEEKNVGVIFIDFLQKMETGDRYGNTNDRFTKIASGLKNLAKDLNIPIISIASLSREVEKRGGLKRPELQDLRDSGSIESEADTVLFVWRPKYYELNDDTGRPYTNEVEYIHGKGRFTKQTDIILYHDQYMTNFYDTQSESHQIYELTKPKDGVNFRDFYNSEKFGDDVEF